MTDCVKLLKAWEEVLELKRQKDIVTESWQSQQRETANLKTVKSWHKGVVFLPGQEAVCLNTLFYLF